LKNELLISTLDPLYNVNVLPEIPFIVKVGVLSFVFDEPLIVGVDGAVVSIII